MNINELDFFICHAQEEYQIAKGFKNIFDSLEINAYVAHTTIPNGEDWHLHIIEKLKKSKNILILATENLNNRSQYCHFEIGYAEHRELDKYIFFLDNLSFSPYIDRRHQGFEINKNNIENVLRRFFSDIITKKFPDINTKKVDESFLINLKDIIYEHLVSLTRAKNVLVALQEGNELENSKVINNLDDAEKKKLITGALQELQSQESGVQNQSNLINFVITLFNNESVSGIRIFIIRETFDFLINKNSLGLKELLKSMCPNDGKTTVRYKTNDINYIKDNYLDFFIDFFAKETNSFETGRMFSHFLFLFKHRFEKNQLERLYVSMLCNVQINSQNFSYENEAITILKKLFRMQSDKIPKIISELDYIDRRIEENQGFSIIREEKFRKKVIARYPDIFEKFAPSIIKCFNDTS